MKRDKSFFLSHKELTSTGNDCFNCLKAQKLLCFVKKCSSDMFDFGLTDCYMGETSLLWSACNKLDKIANQ